MTQSAYASSLAEQADVRQAVDSASREVLEQLDGRTADLVFAFFTPTHARSAAQLSASLREQIGCRHLVGCTAEWVAGGGRELEDAPGLSVWAASMPGAEIVPFHVTFERTPDGVLCNGVPPAAAEPAAPPGQVVDSGRSTAPRGGDPREPAALFLLADPFTTAADAFLTHLADEHPQVPCWGGMASGARQPGQNVLLLGDSCLDTGGVGILIRGGPPIQSLVSQGCRPVGKPFIVTKSDRNAIFELGGLPALKRLQEIFAESTEEEQALMRGGLHLGIVLNEYQERFSRGDFLIANVLGADHGSGALGVGAAVRTGQTVQFHVRDASTAHEDLTQLLQHAQGGGRRPRAALMFTCNGRGTRLFSQPNHDASAIQEICGPIPLAGFCAQGELGPVAGQNHVHGFTASVALFG